MSVEYNRYLEEHRSNVLKGFKWFQKYLPNLVEGIDPKDVYKITELHDESKNFPDEYEAYDNYFYGNKSYEVVQEFNLAWLKHIHRNPHHWQYWVLINDDPDAGEKILDMPMKYIIEMICDWWSFSWNSGNLNEIFDWYEEREDYIKLSNYTKAEVKYILTAMKDKLNPPNLAEGA